MSDFFTSSDLTNTRAYLSAVPKEQVCIEEARHKMGLDKGHPDFAQGETGRKQAANFKAAYDKAYNDCIKNWGKTSESKPEPAIDIEGFDAFIQTLTTPPYIYIIGAVGVMIVGVLIGRAIR